METIFTYWLPLKKLWLNTNQYSDMTAKNQRITDTISRSILSRTSKCRSVPFWATQLTKHARGGQPRPGASGTMSYRYREKCSSKENRNLTSVFKYLESCHMQEGLNIFCTVLGQDQSWGLQIIGRLISIQYKEILSNNENCPIMELASWNSRLLEGFKPKLSNCLERRL